MWVSLLLCGLTLPCFVVSSLFSSCCFQKSLLSHCYRKSFIKAQLTKKSNTKAHTLPKASVTLWVSLWHIAGEKKKKKARWFTLSKLQPAVMWKCNLNEAKARAADRVHPHRFKVLRAVRQYRRQLDAFKLNKTPGLAWMMEFMSKETERTLWDCLSAQVVSC